MQYYHAHGTWLQPQGIEQEVISGMSDLEIMESRMCRKMKSVRELSKISEFE